MFRLLIVVLIAATVFTATPQQQDKMLDGAAAFGESLTQVCDLSVGNCSEKLRPYSGRDITRQPSSVYMSGTQDLPDIREDAYLDN